MLLQASFISVHSCCAAEDRSVIVPCILLLTAFINHKPLSPAENDSFTRLAQLECAKD